MALNRLVDPVARQRVRWLLEGEYIIHRASQRITGILKTEPGSDGTRRLLLGNRLLMTDESPALRACR